MLSINFMPHAIYDPSTCIRATLAAASKANFPLDRLLFEEHRWLERARVRLAQGYLYARPAFEALPEITWP